jgi:hypothetical protein
MNKHWHKGTDFPEYDDDIVFVSEDKTTVGYFDTLDENFIKHSTCQIFHPEEVTKWAYANDIEKQPMDEDKYNYIIDAMCMALNLLDDLSNPDFDKEYDKLNIAVDIFYNWYNNKGE